MQKRKKMTKQELISLKFKRQDVYDSESQNGYDYHYYSLELVEGLKLLSCDSDNIDAVLKDSWYVYNYNWPTIKFRDIEKIKSLIEIFNG